MEALFLRITTDEDSQVTVAPYSPTESEVTEAVIPQTDQQQHMIQPFLPQDTLLSSPGAMSVPVGLSSKELAQLRANALRAAGPTNSRLPDLSPAATIDRDV